jgi:dihydrofolate reductase
MRKIIFQPFMSLDGYGAGRGDSTDFVPASTRGDQSFGKRQLEFMDSIDTMLLGRVTYEMFAGYWPDVTSGDDKEFADKINATRKYVFSRTLDHAPWGAFGDATIIRSRTADEVEKLKQQSGKNMVIWGSLSLAQSLDDDGLVDEFQLIVCPVVLGSGKRLFRESGAFDLSLRDSRSFDRGTVLLTYDPSRERAGAGRR